MSKPNPYTYEDRTTLRRQIRDRRGRRYGLMKNGQVVRLSPSRPWRGKAQRRIVLGNREHLS